MSGSTVATAAGLTGPDANWRVSQTFDLNADKKADLIWTKDDGSIRVWLIDGVVATSMAPVTGPGFAVVP